LKKIPDSVRQWTVIKEEPKHHKKVRWVEKKNAESTEQPKQHKFESLVSLLKAPKLKTANRFAGLQIDEEYFEENYIEALEVAFPRPAMPLPPIAKPRVISQF